MKRVLLFATILIVATLSIILYRHMRGEAVHSVTCIVYADEVDISSEVAAKIESITVREGDGVKEGQPLVRLNAREINAQMLAGKDRVAESQGLVLAQEHLVVASQADLEAARSTLERLQESLAQNRREEERRQHLYDEKIYPREDLERSQLQVTTLARQVEEEEKRILSIKASLAGTKAKMASLMSSVAAAKAEVARLEAEAQKYSVVSPCAGVVSQRYAHPGERAVAGTPILTILASGTLKARFYLPQNEVENLHPGDTIPVLSEEGTTCEGKVIEIGREGVYAEITDVKRGRLEVPSFRVLLSLPPDCSLHPGALSLVEMP